VGISVEEMCVRFETFVKLKEYFAHQKSHKLETETMVRERAKLLE